MAEARFVGAPLRLRLGGRRLFAGAHGAAGRMHAGADGRDGGRQEGADRLSDGHAGERSKLEGTTRRFEGARLGRRAASGHWRWRARVLEGPRRGVPDDASSAMLAAQDIERARQAPEVAATQRAQGSARDLAVAEPGRGGSGDDDLRREIRAQIRQGRRMPDQGSADTADVLRPSRRSLGPLANLEPDRERVRDGEASHRPHERRVVPGHRAPHGVQTGDGRVQDLAAFERSKPVAESRQRYKVQRRNRNCRRNQIRHLIHAVTDFPASLEPEPPRRMTASQEASLDAWMIKTYLACWKPAAQPADANRYVARVRLKFKPDGSLLKPPKLVNPPSDPAQKPQAKSVLQAVKACDPLPMPAQYRSFYEQWKTKTILFDPQVAAR